ncbi:MAG TPA: ECF-type sigma factor [Rubrivivax sp.]|nr:ECF-type sigma factor [Rubrivivax sp.]
MDDAAVPPSSPRAQLDDRFAELYDELRVIARSRLRRHDRGGITSTGALVHECWMRLQRAGRLRFGHEGEFLALAATVMRSLIVDMARRARAEQRGGGAEHVPLDTTLADSLGSDDEESHDVVVLDEALTELARFDARAAQVVEMRFFAGLADAQIAAALGVSERTVRRDWDRSRAFLALALRR